MFKQAPHRQMKMNFIFIIRRLKQPVTLVRGFIASAMNVCLKARDSQANR
jgi:hypothetical protein